MEENKDILTQEELAQEIEMDDYDYENAGGGLGKIMLAVGALGIAALGGVIYKNKDKFEARKVEKLRKKGYVIYKADECEVHQIEVDDNAESEEESEATE